MNNSAKIYAPLTDIVVENLHAGDRVSISGIMYTARDLAHQYMVEQQRQGKKLPFDLTGQILYYTGPTPAQPGRTIGSAGPATSYRMDRYTIPLLEQGLKGMIGKGPRGKDVKDAIIKYKAVYFATIGGAGALISKAIKMAEVVAFEEIGAEAMMRLEVQDFPAIVVSDAYGADLYQIGVEQYKEIGGSNDGCF